MPPTPTRIRIVSAASEALTIAAALDVAVGERDHWRALAESRLVSLWEAQAQTRASRLETQRVRDAHQQVVDLLEVAIRERNAEAEGRQVAEQALRRFGRPVRWWRE